MTQTVKLHLCLHLYEFALCYCYLNELLVEVAPLMVCICFKYSNSSLCYALEPIFISSASMLFCDVPMLGSLTALIFPLVARVCSCCYTNGPE
jgi:hypothetical protein